MCIGKQFHYPCGHTSGMRITRPCTFRRKDHDEADSEVWDPIWTSLCPTPQVLVQDVIELTKPELCPPCFRAVDETIFNNGMRLISEAEEEKRRLQGWTGTLTAWGIEYPLLLQSAEGVVRQDEKIADIRAAMAVTRGLLREENGVWGDG